MIADTEHPCATALMALMEVHNSFTFDDDDDDCDVVVEAVFGFERNISRNN
jgi:hypothetical protein